MHAVLAILKWTALVLIALVALLAFVLAVLPILVRPMTDRLGATDAEVAERLPGDELVTSPQQNSTRAVSADASPALVFALIKQMGYRRGGWYGWDWFYRMTGSAEFIDGHHSDTIDPRLQDIGLGDTMYLMPGGGLEILEYRPPSGPAPYGLVMYKNTDANNKQIPRGTQSPTHSDMSWVWLVAPEADGTSRIILRTRSSTQGMPGWYDWMYDKPLEMGGAMFGYKTLRGIARTAEKLQRAGVVVDDEGRQVAGPR
jgi:hypothetical protein